MMAVYLGEVDEEKINNMTIIFFDSVLAALGKRVNYDAVVNYAGNSFAKDSWKMIQEANPLIKKRKVSKNFVNLINKHIKVAETVTDITKVEGFDWMNSSTESIMPESGS